MTGARGPERIWVAGFMLLTLIAASPCAALDLVAVVKKVEPAVVRIDTNKGVGSGVVIDDQGLVFTNFHVIADAPKPRSRFARANRSRPRVFWQSIRTRNLALLKIDKLTKPTALKIATALPETGQPVASFGSPLGFSFTASEGIVSAVRKGEEVRKIVGDALYRELGYGGDATWVQSTAAISPGNSGGPLVNMNGEVLGLNTWTNTEGQNINFAISMQDMAARARQGGSRRAQVCRVAQAGGAARYSGRERRRARFQGGLAQRTRVFVLRCSREC